MGKYNIHLSKQAAKALDGMDRPTQQRIRAAIMDLPSGDTKMLKGHKGLFRLRVGDWRVIFSYPDANTIIIDKIAPRGEVYKGV